MNKKLVAVLGAATALFFPSSNGVTFTFDEVSLINAHVPLPTPYQGYLFNPTLKMIDLSSRWSGTGPDHTIGNTEDNAILNNSGGNGVITKDGGGTFTFSDLWIRTWYDININFSSGTRSIQGFNGATLSYSIPMTLDTTWQQVQGNDTPIDKLVIVGGNHFLVDDLTLNAFQTANDQRLTSVPEHSSTLVLFGLGIAALGLARRKMA